MYNECLILCKWVNQVYFVILLIGESWILVNRFRKTNTNANGIFCNKVHTKYHEEGSQSTSIVWEAKFYHDIVHCWHQQRAKKGRHNTHGRHWHYGVIWRSNPVKLEAPWKEECSLKSWILVVWLKNISQRSFTNTMTMSAPHHRSRRCTLRGQQAAFQREVGNRRRKCSACIVQRTFHSAVHQILKGKAQVNHNQLWKVHTI